MITLDHPNVDRIIHRVTFLQFLNGALPFFRDELIDEVAFATSIEWGSRVEEATRLIKMIDACLQSFSELDLPNYAEKIQFATEESLERSDRTFEQLHSLFNETYALWSTISRERENRQL